MSVHTRVMSYVKNLLFKDRLDRDLDAELQSFVEMSADEHRSSGLPADEARRAALLDLGGFDQVKESVRDVRSGALLDQVRQDLSYALRMLRRHLGFTAVAVTTLTFGIGANSAIFSVVDTIVFRGLPYADPSRLVKICGNALAQATDDVTVPDFIDIRDSNHVFERLAADDGTSFTVTHRDRSTERILGAFVTASWLPTLGVQPMLGRTFLPEEEQTGRDQVVILTNAYWRRRFNSDPNIVGTTLAVGDKPHTIIGVLPANVLRYSSDFLKPLAFEYPADRKAGSLDVFARLAPGVTLAQAQAELDTIASQLQREYPATNKDRRFTLLPLDKYYAAIEGKASRGLLLMLGAVGLVMLIACANVANLLLARGVARNKECVVRAALGANRARLVRQMLAESVLLFLVGGVLGALLARWLVDSLLALAIAGNYVPERMIVAIDARVFVFTLLLSLVAGVASGLGPALQASRVDLNNGLRASSPTLSGRRHRASRLLIVSELALSLVLLVGFGLLIRSFVNVEAESASMDGESLLVTDAEGGRDFSQAVAYWQEALDRVRRVPGVQFAAVSSRPPVHDARSQWILIEGHAPASDHATPMAGDILVSADYFRTMKIPILKGRAFTDGDTGGAPRVIIVSESLARRFFPGENPIGWHVSLKERLPMTCCSAPGPVENVWREIVGVAADIRQANLDDDLAETVYRPYTQIVEHDMFLTIRTLSGSDTTRVATQVRSALLTMKGNNDWPVRSMQQIIDDSQSIRLRRFVLILLGTFAALALALAAVGTYGVMTYSVAERTREIGIRMALGATRPAVLRQVLSETTRLTLAGLMLGALAALALTRFISAMLFGISAADGVTYLGVSFVLASVALLASYLPARRATDVDPIAALRHE